MESAEHVAEVTRLLRKTEGEANALNAELIQTRGRLDKRFAEIAKLTRLYHENEQQLGQQRQQAEWLRQFHAAMQTFPRWWSCMPQGWRRPRELRRLQRMGLFDGSAYLARYPDVAAEAMDPLRHYILHGLKEGRERF